MHFCGDSLFYVPTLIGTRYFYIGRLLANSQRLGDGEQDRVEDEVQVGQHLRLGSRLLLDRERLEPPGLPGRQRLRDQFRR